MNRRKFIATTVGLVVPLTAGCTTASDGEEPVVETNTVAMVDNTFDPRNVHVSAGSTVTWTNGDTSAHTVTSATANWSFDENVSGGSATQFTFEESGVYGAYDRFHGSADLSGMSMKIGVGDATIEEPLPPAPLQPSTAPM